MQGAPGGNESSVTSRHAPAIPLIAVGVIERLDGRPDPIGLLFEQTAESNRIGRLGHTHPQALARLIFAGRHNQGLNRGFALAFFRVRNRPWKRRLLTVGTSPSIE